MPDLLSMNGLMETTNKMQYHIAPSEVKTAIIKTLLHIIGELFSLSLSFY